MHLSILHSGWALLLVAVLSCDSVFGAEKEAVLEIRDKSRIAFIGGGLGSRMNEYGHLETQLQTRYPEAQLYIRNMCKEGDTPAFRPHASKHDYYAFPGAKELVKEEYQVGEGRGHYESPDEMLTRHEIDTLIGFFGYSESYDGVERVNGYKEELRAFIKHSLSATYADTALQLAIVGPQKFEDVSSFKDIPGIADRNAALSAYRDAMKEVCREEGVLFIDAYEITQGLYDQDDAYLTNNGQSLTPDGYKQLAPILADQLFGKAENKTKYAEILPLVQEKNRLWLLDYKIPNGVHVHGRRFKPFGDVNYPEELEKTRQMTAIREEAIWAANRGEAYDVAAKDKETRKLSPIETNFTKEVKYYSAEEMIETIETAEGYKISLFADETRFPRLANPCQMSFDNKGRMWVGCMPSYPHYRIGDPKPEDCILIYEDTDNDGVADKETLWLEDIELPIGFEITEYGVVVSQGSNLMLYKDTDGDDKADYSEILVSGFDDHDTHHNISAFCADPSGAVYMGEGNFARTSIETPYGTQRGNDGGFFRYVHSKANCDRIGNYYLHNPWGIAFDKWGQDFALQTSSTDFFWINQSAIKMKFARSLYVDNLLTSNNVRPTSGLEFISSRHFPDEIQGDVLLCNTIGFLGAKQHRVFYDEEGRVQSEYRQDLFKSPAQTFRPCELEFAPDGSLYFIDWSNALIGHMQHSARDPLRDHQRGRIYRVTYPSRPLVTPPKIHGASVAELLDNLKLHEDRARYRTRRELRRKNPEEVLPALTQWVAGLDQSGEHYERYVLEALWVSWGYNQIDGDLLQACLQAKELKVRAAAVRALRYNFGKVEGAQEWLLKAAADPIPLVRHEAMVAATWLPKDIGLAVFQEYEKQPIPKWSMEAYKFGKGDLSGDPYERPEDQVELPAHLKDAKDWLKTSYKRGKVLYESGENCSSCHQKDGKGLENIFPPLDGAEWVTGDKNRLIKLTLHGLVGEIQVKGKTYNGAMPGFAHRVENQDIADMLTYIRNAWSNKAGDNVGKRQVDSTLEKFKTRQNMWEASELSQ